MMELNKDSKCRWYFGWHLFGVAFIAFGISLFIFFPDFFNNQLLKNLELRPDSRTFSEWKKPTVPLYFDIYLFNWTNPNEIKNESSKPRFEQLGPYRFREFPDKLNISFDESGSSVNYRKFSTYHFDQDGSNGSLSDSFTTINMVALGAGSKAKNWNYFLQFTLSVTLRTYKQELHVTKTVKELLFDGYEDSMMKLSTIFNNDTPFTRVGFLINKNGTDELSGNYNVKTGVDDISLLGSINKFNNLTEFPFYEGDCKKLKGSAGEFFSPSPSTTKPIHLFTPDMCRAIPYEYEKSIELHGVTGRRFAAGARALDNGTQFDENKCFASDESMPSGVMNISTCNFDYPMFMSFPHFYGADDSYLEAVDGLAPDKEKHQAYFTLEPKTGITLEVTARFQTNLLIRQYCDYVPLFKKVPRIFMPIFWVEQTFVMDAEHASQIEFALKVPIIGKIAGIVLLISGIVLMSIKHLKPICGFNEKSQQRLSKLHSNLNNGAVSKEMKPLVISKTQEAQIV